MLGLQSKMSSPGRISANLTGGGAIENAWKRVERGERERVDHVHACNCQLRRHSSTLTIICQTTTTVATDNSITYNVYTYHYTVRL